MIVFVLEAWEVKILTERPLLGTWKTSLGTLVIASGMEEILLGAVETPLKGEEICLERGKLHPASGGPPDLAEVNP